MEKFNDYINNKKIAVELEQSIKTQPKNHEELLLYMFDVLKAYNLDQASFVATALFVAIDQKELDYQEIENKYGEDVKNILINLNKVGIKHSATNSAELENVRNMLIVMSQDVRVLLILLAYNLYKVEHLEELGADERKHFVKSVKEIYAPLSARLSLNVIKNKMEDACFKFIDPEMYKQLSSDERLNKEERQKQVDIVITKISKALSEMGIKGKVYGREKHLASVYNKLKSKQLSLGQIYDLMAVRVIVDSVEECYSVLGKINSIFTILPSRFKDYIATPKPNGYKSIHTCILAENNRPVEVQIRTNQMHHFNEYGVAAHWIYKDKGHKSTNFDKSINWLKEIIDENQDLSNKEFTESVKMDMFNSEIYSQTPNGKIIKFPVGANCIDFAYAVHTNIGNRCVGAKINGKFVPLTTELRNGDVCEILLGPENKGPSRDWLKVVKTSSAKAKINNYFKKEFIETNIKNGKAMLENSAKLNQVPIADIANSDKLKSVLSKYSLSSIDELYAMVGSGKLNSENIVKRLEPKLKPQTKTIGETKHISVKNNILVDNSRGMMTRFAKCCLPIPGDKIVGFVSLGKGVTVHREDCVNVSTLNHDRFIPVSWDTDEKASYLAKICITSDEASISQISNIIDKLSVKISSFEINPLDTKQYLITVSVKSNQELKKVISKIKTIDKVIKVERV